MPALHKMHLCGNNTKKNIKKNLWTWQILMISLFVICVFRLLPTPPNHPKKISPVQPTQLPTSVACVLRSSRRCCRKARAKRNSELSTPATYGGRKNEWSWQNHGEKNQKKGLEFLFWGGCWLLWEVFCWGRDFWGERCYLLVGWLTVTHYDSDVDGTTSCLPLRYAWWNCPLRKPRTNQALSLQVGRDLGCFWVAQMLKRCFTHVGSNVRGQICNIEIYSSEN